MLVKLTAAIAVLVGTLVLAACGGDGGGLESGSGDTDTSDIPTAQGGKPSGELTISNWPLYIDKQTIPDFEDETGVTVKYIEDVNDNAEFFGKVQPQLDQGESGGRSIFVVTDWMANKMHELGYLQNFDKSAMPNNEKNLVPSLQNPPFDPNRDYSMPWQTGMTGLVVRKDLAPDVTSICDLFDPQYAGKVEMLTEMRDTVPLVMKCRRRRPREGDRAGLARRDRQDPGRGRLGPDPPLHRQRLRRDLTSGDAVAVIGWSGDAVQLQADDPNIEFRMPEEGCMLWSDNMVIPIGAPNPAAAEAFMNYVYDPESRRRSRTTSTTSPRSPGPRRSCSSGTRARQEPADLPRRAVHRDCTIQVLSGGRGGGRGGVRDRPPRLTATRRRPVIEVRTAGEPVAAA